MMNFLELETVSLLVTVVTSVLSVLLLIAVSRQLWTLRWTITRDRESNLPLPKGSMGWPLVGETFHWLFQGPNFHVSRREKYGNVFKTHLLGKPVIRVTGAENVRKILLGEHHLVCTQWPQSTRIILGPNTLANSIGDVHKKKRKILAKAFSRQALETYVPRLQDVVKREVGQWCSESGPTNVYAATKVLTFRIAVQVLLGLNIEETQINYLASIFEQLMNNLFSLPIDVSFSGLRKGIKAREILHSFMEKMIEEKLQRPSEGFNDAFDYILSSAKENNHDLTVQELKETAVELIFAAHSTTASASTSLILLLLLHPSVAQRARVEIKDLELSGTRCDQLYNAGTRRNSVNQCDLRENTGGERITESTTLTHETRNSKNVTEEESKYHLPHLTLERLSAMRYLDCVVKEVLRYFPPVSGGYRTVLKTFELDGCQIPKGWSVLYSIRDTHETAPVYQCPGTFDPDRFAAKRDESKTGRFNYIPFGGGIRNCIGKELAKIIIKTLAVELLATTEWRIATQTIPKMQTVPVVHPASGLYVNFNYTDSWGKEHCVHT
ncbi:cytochrome P450 26B1-like [Chanos chanos]|uniref:Cytochrome P450 26B1-like n=1 Tax=Chanos chanos TaxID=29144 RepID=A0A6J2VGA9_CHACN|nr:cytochrome P450 26B1-like [Chanos chanos]